MTLWDVSELMEYFSKPKRKRTMEKRTGDKIQELRGELARFGIGSNAGPLPEVYRDK